MVPVLQPAQTESAGETLHCRSPALGLRWSELLRASLAVAFLLALAVGAPALADDPLIAAAGDIACDPTHPAFHGGAGTATLCRQRATSDLLLGGGYDAVLTLGDNQYLEGELADYQASFAPSWGRVKPLLRPVPGNHEYLTPGAAGYFDYFGAAAGERGRGWYSYDLGTWHVVVLNSNCAAVGGCGAGSPQLLWLAEDLAAHPRACTLAYWHHPRFSSGLHGDDPTYDAFWRVLYAAGADVVLVGHDHDYERFAPQDPDGRPDLERGIRQFVVGTGGMEIRPFGAVRANSEVRNANTFGVLRLELRPDGYDWRFLPAAGGSFTDSGSGGCHHASDSIRVALRQGRFEAEVTWRDFVGRTGKAWVAAPATDASALFWFFSPDNWELMVKVLDGCALNGRFWVFHAASTNVEYTLTVTDTVTGQVRRYDNPLGRRAPAVTDTAAFATCP